MSNEVSPDHPQPWRWEAEISAERQQFLLGRQSVKSDIAKGQYPFSGIKLSRADIEWLIAEYDGRQGPVDGDKKDQREPRLDLRGADLINEDLRGLPLSGLLGGLGVVSPGTAEQRRRAGIHLEGANLLGVHLEGAVLSGAHLERAELLGVHLEGANLLWAHLEEAELPAAHLEAAYLYGARLEGANLHLAHLEGSVLSSAHLEGADLSGASLEGADLTGAYLQGANLAGGHLGGKHMDAADIERVGFQTERFNSKVLPADLRRSQLDGGTVLDGISLGDRKLGFAWLADVCWGGANLAVVDWPQVGMLGDEREAYQRLKANGFPKNRDERISDFEAAVRTYRQLATALRSQGMNEQANKFSYHAQVLQRHILWLGAGLPDRKFREWSKLHFPKLGAYFISLLLDKLTGYGYKLGNTFFVYLLVIATFMVIYHVYGAPHGGPLDWKAAFVVSLTAFHGRGFFPEQFTPDDPQTFVAGIEAFVGLLVEVSFIATFTQRFFNR